MTPEDFFEEPFIKLIHNFLSDTRGERTMFSVTECQNYLLDIQQEAYRFAMKTVDHPVLVGVS